MRAWCEAVRASQKVIVRVWCEWGGVITVRRCEDLIVRDIWRAVVCPGQSIARALFCSGTMVA